jgi:hypothetical protein
MYHLTVNSGRKGFSRNSAMARLRGAFDAEQARTLPTVKPRDDLLQDNGLKDLLLIRTHEGRIERGARTLGDASRLVPSVLECPHLNRRSELWQVQVPDVAMPQELLQSGAIREGISRAANPASGPEVDHEIRVRGHQCFLERRQ